MSTEQTWVPINGQLVAGQTAQAAARSYDRLLTLITPIAKKAPAGANMTFKLTLDEVAQAAVYSLTNGLLKTENSVAAGAGITVEAAVYPGIEIVTASDAEDLAFWFEMTVTDAANTETGWIMLTAAMLQSRISAPEYERLTSSLIQYGQSDPVPSLLDDVTERVRNAIRSGGRVGLGATDTIPASLRDAALSIVKYRLFGRVSILRSLAEMAKDDAEAAERQLERIEDGKTLVEGPSTVSESAAGKHGTAHDAPDRTTKRSDLDGL